MKKVDFFIIGAPKCGTTSLYEYLHSHPDICFSDSKEPHYFSHDFPGYCTTYSVEEYHQKEFNHCSSDDVLRGEGSVWYLYSKVAVKEIHEYNPDARILIMLRNPIDMLCSLHSQLLYNLDEDVTDFKEAWGLQEQRAALKNIPKWCRVPEFLQYKNIGMYSTQLERVYEVFPVHQIKVILFDDLVNDPGAVYSDVLGFLGLEKDGRSNFQVTNSNKSLIFEPLAVFIQRPPAFIVSMVTAMKKLLGVHRFGIYPILNKINVFFNTRKQSRRPLCIKFKKTIFNVLVDDINKTEELIGRDLSSWKKLQ